MANWSKRTYRQQNPRQKSKPSEYELERHIAFNERHFGSAEASDYRELAETRKSNYENEKAERGFWDCDRYGSRW